MGSTYIGYLGKVKLSLKIKDKIYNIVRHNAGTEALQQSICRYLSGNSGNAAENAAWIPQMLDLRRSLDGGLTWSTYLNQEIPLGAKKYIYTSDSALGIASPAWVARFEASLPYAALIEEIPSSVSSDVKFKFVLYGNYDTTNINEPYHDLAELEVAPIELARITKGTQAFIEWTMQIINVTTEE